VTAARVPDYRSYAFSLDRVDASGLSAGRSVYRQLYVLENVLRVVVHSVLLAQVGTDWWRTAVDPHIQETVRGERRRYEASPGRTRPGSHEIYYTYLRDLNEILRANSDLFRVVVVDVEWWIVRIEQIRGPRNIVGHMNWPSSSDRVLITHTLRAARRLAAKLVSAGLPLTVP
jgi:hypothetical protein